MALLEECLGPYYQAVSPTMLTRKRENANEANEALMALVRARLAVFQEPEAGEVIQAGTVKAITGEDTMSSRANYGKQLKFRPKFKSFLVANDLPTCSEATAAMFRRIRIVHFPTSFVEHPTEPHERKIDFQLDDKLKTAAPHFIAILIHWYRKYQVEGLREPDPIRRSTEKYQNENDLVKSFIQENLELVGTAKTPSKESGVELSDLKLKLKDMGVPATAPFMRKLGEALGKLETTSKSFDGYVSLVGITPDISKCGKYNFRGYYGWRWRGAPPQRSHR